MRVDEQAKQPGVPKIAFSSERAALPDGPAALVIGHPGHELRVFGWLGMARPSVSILTNGSGRSGESRLGSTSKVLESAGASRGSIYGRLSDKEAYQALLSRDFEVFTSMAAEMAHSFAQPGVRYVVGDAIEGYNPIHDVCRLLVNAAVALAARDCGREIVNFEFVVSGDPAKLQADDNALNLTLEDEAFQQKLAAIRGYAELSADVDDLFTTYGSDAFRVECFCPSGREPMDKRLSSQPPLYESIGEKRVSKGYYDRVITYREHVRPLAEALANLITA
jgi:AcrR family transcriptional regulator